METFILPGCGGGSAMAGDDITLEQLSFQVGALTQKALICVLKSPALGTLGSPGNIIKTGLQKPED